MTISTINYIGDPMSPAELSDGRSLDEILTRIPSLSDRETEVFYLLAAGPSNRTISTRLHITERTAKAHVAQILAKLDVESRMQAGIVAFAWGVLRRQVTLCPGCPCHWSRPNNGSPISSSRRDRIVPRANRSTPTWDAKMSRKSTR